MCFRYSIGYQMKNKLRSLLYFLFFCALLAFIAVSGCGPGDGGLSAWGIGPEVEYVSNIRGKVAFPEFSSLASLVSASRIEGATVFIESAPEYNSVADSSGLFEIKNVPAGNYRVIAEVVSGNRSYRQRSDLIRLTGQFEFQTLQTPLVLRHAPHRLRLNITDLRTDAPVSGAKVKLWGRETQVAANGDVEIGPVPEGMWPVSVKAIGYHPINTIFGFSDEKNSKLFFKMTPLTSVDGNRGPIVEISQDFRTMGTWQKANLTASGFDLDGDRISYKWWASTGSLSQTTGMHTVYTAPEETGPVEIRLTGTDPDGAEGMAILNFDVVEGQPGPIADDNRPPYPAFDPFPPDFSENMGTDVVLRWSGKDPDDDPLNYDVLFATEPYNLRVIASRIEDTRYRVRDLLSDQTYYWQIISRDIYGAISPGPEIWRFRTGHEDNLAPFQPSNPSPANNSTDQPLSIIFSWSGGDPDPEDIVTYRFYFSDNPNVLQHIATIEETTYKLEELEHSTEYFWQVIAADNRGKETPGPVWHFTTLSKPNQPPNNPVVVYPPDGSSNVPLSVQLQWSATDPDGDELTFDVYLGQQQPLEKIAQDIISQAYYAPEGYYEHSTEYFWQVIARDEGGLTNPESAVWSFTTSAPVERPPNKPEALFPVDEAENVSLRPTISWQGGHPDGKEVLYDFYLDTEELPTNLRASGITQENWSASADLQQNTWYYWRVRAYIGELEVDSDIYRFKTRADSDESAPEIISITPAPGSVDLPLNTEIRITFSEAIDQSAFLAAPEFLPQVAGTWNWINDSTVRFWTNAWNSGAHYKLKLDSSDVQDLSGNMMEEDFEAVFTFKAPIPIPEGFKSVGFPVEVGSGDFIEVSVPELPSGALSYALVVADSADTEFDVDASVMPSGFKHCSAFRYFERNLAGIDFPSVMTSDIAPAAYAPLSSAQVGDVEEFYIPQFGNVATSTPYPNNVIQARCYRVSAQSYIFVDEKIAQPSDALMDGLRSAFENNILPTIRDVFGNEPATGPDGDERITILLTDGLRDGVAGIFNSADLFARSVSNVQLRESNERKIVYVTYSLDSEVTRHGVIAHELQHMVNFWQKRMNAGSGVFETIWLNEGLSKYAEEVCGYGVLDGDRNTALLLRLSQQNMSNLSLTQWEGLNSYGLAYLFVRFLAHEGRYGTTYRDVTRQLVRSGLTGISNVESVTSEGFSNTLARWALSLYLNRHQSGSPDEYGFYNLNLEGTYEGVQLPGFEIYDAVNVSNVNLLPNGVRLFKKRSIGDDETTIELNNFSSDAKIWMLDQRP